ncbi:phosphatase PAP2 family protein [Hoeflea sp.]|uniref:phosphatase PAP2 family protein n=1 Tax=Hoeflea sp. TaxID=1940281 RepID=UPI003B020A38
MATENETDAEELSGRTGLIRQAGRKLTDRFRTNLAASRAFLKSRRANGDADTPVHGYRYFFLTVMVVFLVAVVLDNPVGAYRNQWPTDVLKWAHRLTDIGKSGWILVPTGVFVLACYFLDWRGLQARTRLTLAKWVAASGYVFIAVGMSGLIVAIAKRLIGRARPVHFEELGAFYFQPFSNASFASFPSGHSTTSGAFFAAIAIFFPALRFPALVLAIWLGFTRVLVGAHYPSDVLAGLAFGAWYAYFTALFFAGYGFIFKIDKNGLPVRRKGYELQKFLLQR